MEVLEDHSTDSDSSSWLPNDLERLWLPRCLSSSLHAFSFSFRRKCLYRLDGIGWVEVMVQLSKECRAAKESHHALLSVLYLAGTARGTQTRGLCILNARLHVYPARRSKQPRVATLSEPNLLETCALLVVSPQEFTNNSPKCRSSG